jgi:tRNA(fMet)-specific endonuclease VapC
MSCSPRSPRRTTSPPQTCRPSSTASVLTRRPVGTLLDKTVFVELERATRELPPSLAMRAARDRLEGLLGADEEVGIATITASELLHGVHRASEEHRATREAFVETTLNAFPALPFDLLAARIHARIWAQLAAAGRDIGAHDRIVAATAIASGWRVATANERHFLHIPGLRPATVSLS